ncbi:UbiA family prenyltransferase [Actinokineospora iranica]|uniref:UbiA family prenyltransferase n=1 Tax=Actinokineospora iranica TaxID=1271860 RepID=UPI001E2A1C8A|nr:UbiA family prenyltransferase [Actinokineospora iranica]
MGLGAALGQVGWWLVALGAAVLTGQLSVGWLNDLVDADRDARVGRGRKPVAAGEVAASAVWVAVVAAAVGTVVLSLGFGAVAGAAHILAVVVAWAYNLRLKATVFSVVPYAVSFGLLVAFVTLGLPGPYPPPWWMVATASLLGCAAHFANVLPDFDDDRATGVHGLPHRLGAAGSRVAAAVLVLAASATLVAGLPTEAVPLGVAALAVAGAVTAVGLIRGQRPRSRAAFHAMLVVAVLDVAVLIAANLPG